MTSTASESVTLKGGCVVSLSALQLLWTLEERGLCIARDGEQLAVSPRSMLTDTDRGSIREHRDELMALVNYVEEIV